MAGDLASVLLSGNTAPLAADASLAPITQNLELAKALTAASLSGAPASKEQAWGRLGSGLAGLIVQGQANRGLTDYAAGGIKAASEALPANHPLQPFLHSSNPMAQQIGLRGLDKALIQLSDAKALRTGEELSYPVPGTPLIRANTGTAAALAEEKKNPALVARAGETAAAEAPYKPGGEGVVGGQTIPMTAAARKELNDRAARVPTFNERFSGVTGNAKANDALQEGAVKDFVEQSQKHYNSAQELTQRLTTMSHNIEALGPKWMGAGADAKGELGRQWNGMLDTLGVKGFHFDPTKIATWEEFNKESKNAGMALINANFGGSREAASIIKMGTESVPAAQQTYLGAKYNLASIQAAAQRQIDLHEYKARLLQEGKSIVGADVAFNRVNPPEAYAMHAIISQIPPEAVAHLRANPNLATHFDQQFGAGTSAMVLGAK